MRTQFLTADDYDHLADVLASRDRVMDGLVARHRPCRPGPRRTHTEALVSGILHQQVTGASARATWRRLVAALEGRVTATAILEASQDDLRGAGLSGSKIAALRDLASRIGDGSLPVRRLAHLPDDEVVEALISVRGIGEWTAQMFLLFQLRRADVWPTGDYGVRKGWAAAYGGDLPTPAQLESHGDRFRPYRSVAAWYLWRASEAA